VEVHEMWIYRMECKDVTPIKERRQLRRRYLTY
jgi:hypothetical protein